MNVYIVGSLRNSKVMSVAASLREAGIEAFDDWISPGKEADEMWQIYERNRGRSYKEASEGCHAKHVFNFDYEHLMKADAVVVVYPVGKSGMAEMGWFSGWFTSRVEAAMRGEMVIPVGNEKPCLRPAYLLVTEPVDRFDIMPPQFARLTGGGIVESIDELVERLRQHE